MIPSSSPRIQESRGMFKSAWARPCLTIQPSQGHAPSSSSTEIILVRCKRTAQASLNGGHDRGADPSIAAVRMRRFDNSFPCLMLAF